MGEYVERKDFTMKSKTSYRSRGRVSLAIFVAAALVAVMAASAAAQVYYIYPSAPPVKADQPAVGADVGFGDNEFGYDLFRIVGHGRFNVMSTSDLGIELIFDNTDTPVEADAWRWGLGVDYRIAIVPKDSTSMPFDLALNAGFAYQNGGDLWNLRFPVGALVSRTSELKGGRRLVPYGGVYVLFDYASWNWPAGVSGDDSDFSVDVELRAGAGLEINESSMAYVSLFLGSGTKIFLGINFVL